jgi:hypothetical protein
MSDRAKKKIKVRVKNMSKPEPEPERAPILTPIEPEQVLQSQQKGDINDQIEELKRQQNSTNFKLNILFATLTAVGLFCGRGCLRRLH